MDAFNTHLTAVWAKLTGSALVGGNRSPEALTQFVDTLNTIYGDNWRFREIGNTFRWCFNKNDTLFMEYAVRSELPHLVLLTTGRTIATALNLADVVIAYNRQTRQYTAFQKRSPAKYAFNVESYIKAKGHAPEEMAPVETSVKPTTLVETLVETPLTILQKNKEPVCETVSVETDTPVRAPTPVESLKTTIMVKIPKYVPTVEQRKSMWHEGSDDGM